MRRALRVLAWAGHGITRGCQEEAGDAPSSSASTDL